MYKEDVPKVFICGKDFPADTKTTWKDYKIV